ncbi:MAG: alanine:cation symporter family protein [Candidatus Helarchaeota archaeon]|nr:alanine:cation symporter family protein [Candidatus Helarchaeota archaeon]
MEWIQNFTNFLAVNFYNIYMILFLLGTGLFLTIVAKCLQIREFKTGVKLISRGALRKDRTKDVTGDITPFQALAATLSGTIGNGNIAGVATTIALGGPGGILWMWATGMVGMATKFSEVFLSLKYRQTHEDGSMAGGPMYYIKNGLKNKVLLKKFAIPLSIMFAICGAWTALLGTGNMIQSNSIALAFKSQFNIPFWVSGGLVTILAGMVILGGIKRIGAVAELLIPFMLILYVSSALIILLINIDKVHSALIFIVKSSFSYQAAIGGYLGHTVKEAVSYGVSRGLLSNESGMGSAAIVHGAAKTKSPINQGMIAMIGPFIDTILVCTMTALTIIITGAYMKIDPETGLTLTSTALTTNAFNSALPYFGGLIVPLSSFLFGFSTIIGWYYIGEQCLEYLFGIRITKGYKIAYLILCFIGSILQEANLPIVWDIGVVFNGLMAIPNLIALLALSNTIKNSVNEYYISKKSSN